MGLADRENRGSKEYPLFGEIIARSRGVDSTLSTKIKCAREKLWEFELIFMKGLTFNMKARALSACGRVMLYDNDTWAVKVEKVIHKG